MENVKSTLTLKVSLAVLNSDTVMERLKESTIDIRTVEIESTCKLHRVLSKYALPSSLNVLRINDNNLNLKDISELLKSSSSLSSLHILVLCHTMFEDSSFYALISVLGNCKDLISLSLTNNGLTKLEVNCLIITFESMRNLEKLNLSKSNITETQANAILQNLEQANKIASLDLSHNALQGKEIILGICQLQSLQEVDLSHNYIRFFPLPDFKGKHDSCSNINNISLSSNHMTPRDVSLFCSLIKSDLLRLNLDFNHVGNSVLCLCSMRCKFKHLKVLSLANTDISGAVDALAALLSCLGELEELNLSSNNLISADFQQLQSPLSKMSQLKRLNLSNNPDGISILLEEILPSLKNLEELRLSNTHINCDDLKRISDSLASLKSVKYLELGMNAIGPDGIRTLANILKGFPVLEWLDLSRCFLQQDDVIVLCHGLVPLKEIKHLNFSGNMIGSGVLGDDWFLPSTLEELVLSDILHGVELFKIMKPLHNLTKLHLTNLKLRPCDVDVLATTLSSFPKLEELTLANIVVANVNLDKLFSAIKSLGSIKNIELSDITLHNDIVLSDMLSSLLCLEELVLSGMSVVDMDEKRFFGAIKLLNRLRKLDLGGINVREAKALLDMLPSLLLLEEIVFPAVVLGDIGGTVGYFGALVSLRYLKNVDFRWTKMCTSAKEGLARTLPSLQMLQRVVLGEMIGSDNEIYVALGNLKYLKEVDLDKTYSIQTGTAETLGRVLPSWTLLEKLVLHGIRHCDEYVEQLFAALGNLEYLKELHLYCINATEALARVLPALTLLEKLVLKLHHYNVECDEQLFFAALGNLKYLKELHLVNVNITEPGTKALGYVFPSLTLLEKLVLECFSAVNVCASEKLFAALGSLKYLKELHLVELNISKPATEALADVLPSFTLLEKLVLEDIGNVYSYEWHKKLFAALENLKYLKELHLVEIIISKPVIDALDHVLPSLTLLEKVVLKTNNYDDSEQLFTALGNLKNLKGLHFVDINITQPDIEALARVLPSLTLVELSHIDVECQEQLFAAPGNLKYLKELHSVTMNITKPGGIQALAHVLPSLTLLEKLELKKGVGDDDECHEQLFAALGNLKYLRELQLEHLRVSKTGAEALVRASPSLQMLKVLGRVALENDQGVFRALRELRFLEALDLEGTEITKAGVAALADVIPLLGLLKKLRLYDISFKDTSDDQLFTAVGSLSFLNELKLRYSTVTQAGGDSLTATLPRLRNLRKFRLPLIENDKDGTLGKNLKEAASFVPDVR